MNKNEYLAQLAHLLRPLPKEEFEDAMHYVEEYFDEAGVENEQQVIHELGTPEKYAKRILATATIKTNEEPQKEQQKISPTSGIKSIWYIIAGIFALPLAFPIVIVAFVFIVVLLSLLFAFFAILMSLIIASITSAIPLLFSAFSLFSYSIMDGLCAFGASLTLIGISLLVITLIVLLLTHFIPWLIRVLSNLYNRLKGGNQNEAQDSY